MRKSVIIIIAGIYLISIVVIGYFGIRPNSFKEIILAESVRFTNKEIEYDSNGRKAIRLKYEEGLQFYLTWRVESPLTTNKTVSFYMDTDKADVDSDGIITFHSYFRSVEITVKTTDGSLKEDIIKISLTQVT